MKHTLKATVIILLMFLITQFIGLYVVGHYLDSSNTLPYGMDSPEIDNANYAPNFLSIVIAFVIAIAIFFVLTKFKARFVMRIWFLIVVLLALGVTIVAIISPLLPQFKYLGFLALILALPLTLSKIYSRNMISHNFTELLIYPGIAAIFVPLLNVIFLIVLLVLISLYDAWAVWKSGIMQKMAKFQMEQLKVFGGFMIPYLSKSQWQKVKKMRNKDKLKLDSKKLPIKVNVAILGGGDVVFPIISAGVLYKIWGAISIWPAILVIIGALLGLGLLMAFAKKKMYPAMPFISAGILLSMGISYLVWVV